MAQQIIRPHDSARLKTRKVAANLDELGLLPASPNDRPNFYHGARHLARELGAALGVTIKPFGSPRTFLARLNAAFSEAYSGGAGPVFILDFENGTYTKDGVAVALDSILSDIEDASFSETGAVVPGEGLQFGDSTILYSILLKGDALDLCKAGATLIFETSSLVEEVLGAARGVRYELGLDVIAPSSGGFVGHYAQGRQIQDGGHVDCDTRYGPFSHHQEPVIWMGPGANKVAITTAPTRSGMAINGRGGNEAVFPALDPAPTDFTLYAYKRDDAAPDAYIRKLTIRPAVPNNQLADLTGTPPVVTADFLSGIYRLGNVETTDEGLFLWQGSVEKSIVPDQGWIVESDAAQGVSNAFATPALIAALSQGFTVVQDYALFHDTSPATAYATVSVQTLMSPEDYAIEWAAFHEAVDNLQEVPGLTTGQRLGLESYGSIEAAVDAPLGPDIMTGRHRLALTFTDGRVELSVDGSAAISLGSGDLSVFEQFSISLGMSEQNGNGPRIRMERALFYPPVPIGDLPALSIL